MSNVSDNTEAEKVDAGDVYIETLVPEPCEYCEEINALLGKEVPATKLVRVDFRELGKSVVLGKFCDECAETVAASLRGSLPPEESA